MKKLYLILIGLFLISFISASVEHTASTDTICENGVCSLLKDVGISGMEIKEIKINNNILSKWIGEFDNSNYETKFRINNKQSISQDIYIENKNWLFSEDYNLVTTIEIDYNKIIWNGIVYDLTKGNYELHCWEENGDKICPNIFMDDIYNKRINFQDVGEQGGYAYAYSDKGKYYIDLKIDNFNIKAGEKKKIDPTYYNQTDGFSITESGASAVYSMDSNGTDFWFNDMTQNFMYHLDKYGTNKTDGFKTDSNSIQFFTNITDFWIIQSSGGGTIINHTNNVGGEIETINLIGLDSGYYFSGNSTDFWVTQEGGATDYMYHYNYTGNQIDYLNPDDLETGLKIYGIEFNNTDFWVGGTNEFIYHLNSSYNNQSDGFYVGDYGISTLRGIYKGENDNWWLYDATDKFVYHINITELSDTSPPAVTSLTEPTDPATYSLTGTYEFNITITDDTGIGDVLFEFDGTNYTATNITADVYNVTLTGLSAGTYNYNWFANDTLSNINNTESGSYTISKATGDVKAYIKGNRENYSSSDSTESINVSSRFDAGTGDVLLYVNNTIWNNGTGTWLSNTSTFAVGEWNITSYYVGNENYTGDSETWWIIMSASSSSSSSYVSDSVCDSLGLGINNVSSKIPIIMTILIIILILGIFGILFAIFNGGSVQGLEFDFESLTIWVMAIGGLIVSSIIALIIVSAMCSI